MRTNATTTLPTPPERIHGWPACSATARHFGGMTYNGHSYTIAYDEPGQPLVREDVLAAEAKAAAAQTVLHLPSKDRQGGSHD